MEDREGTSKERTASDPRPDLITDQQRNRAGSGGRRISTDVTFNLSQQPAAGKLLNMTVGHHQPLATVCYGDPLRIYRSHILTERRGKKNMASRSINPRGKKTRKPITDRFLPVRLKTSHWVEIYLPMGSKPLLGGLFTRDRVTSEYSWSAIFSPVTLGETRRVKNHCLPLETFYPSGKSTKSDIVNHER